MDADTDPRVQQEADRWFARLLAADCDDRDRAAFEHWRQVPAHARAFAERERLWQRFGAPEVSEQPRVRAMRERVLGRTAPALSDAEATGPDLQQVLANLQPRARARPTHRRRAWAWPVAIAAGLGFLAVGIGLFVVQQVPSETVYGSVAGVREVTLDDGSRLQLDVGTEVAVRYGRRERAVELRFGRALFDVVRDAGRPFVVALGDSRLTVLGTRFQAARTDERVSVTLDTGALRFDGANARSERLAPGDQISYSPAAPAVWDRRHVDSEAVIAWTRGRLIFRTTPLGEAVEEVNRYARPRLRIADPRLAELPVSGNFIAGDSTLVAETWAATLPLRMEQVGNEIVLQPAHR